jgi:hypothetical protein
MFYPGSQIRIREFFHPDPDPGSYVLCKKGVAKLKILFVAVFMVSEVSFKSSAVS